MEILSNPNLGAVLILVGGWIEGGDIERVIEWELAHELSLASLPHSVGLVVLFS